MKDMTKRCKWSDTIVFYHLPHDAAQLSDLSVLWCTG